MKRLTIIVLSILCTLFVSTIAFASPTYIGGLSNLLENTDVDEAVLTLKEGSYSITTAFSIPANYESLIINNNLTSLIVDNMENDTTLFTLESLMLGENGGSVTATGASVKPEKDDKINAFGIDVKGDLTQRGGSITATGGKVDLVKASSATVFGINIEGSFIQHEGSIKATGGEITVNFEKTFVPTGGTEGGGTIGIGDAHAAGINVEGNFTQYGGDIEAIGGIGSNAPGISVKGDFTQNGGSIKATGGKVDDSDGILVIKGDFKQSNGSSIIGYGGSGDGAYGIRLMGGDLIQKGKSSIIAYGGSGEEAIGVGLYSGGSLIQKDEAFIIAIGGTGDMGDVNFGLFVTENLDISNLLVIIRQKEVASVGVGKDFIMRYESILVPIVDLSKLSELASGLVMSFEKAIIESNVELAPYMQNTYLLTMDEATNVKKDVLFLQTNEGIADSFDILINTITLDYEAYKGNSDKDYLLKITRARTPKEAFEQANVEQKYTDFVDELYDLLTDEDTNVDDYPISVLILDFIDNSKEIKGAIRIIDEFVTPTIIQLTWVDVSIRVFNDSQSLLYSKLDDLSVKKYTLWYDSSFSFGKNDEDEEFINRHYLGFAREGERFGVAFQAQLVNGYIARDKVFTEGIAYELSALLTYTFDTSKFWKPELGLIFGYMGNSISGGMKQDALRFGLNMNNMFKVTDLIGIEAGLGLNYTSNLFDLYDYEAYHLPVYEFDSLSLKAGLGVTFNIAEGFKANVHGYMTKELLDVGSSLEKALGEDGELLTDVLVLKEPGDIFYNVGAKLTYNPPKGAGLELGYDININGEYRNYHIKAGFNLQF